MSRFAAPTLLAAAVACAASASFAEDASSGVLHRALDAYAAALEESDRDTRLAGFAEAERGFAAVIENGAHSAALYTNLGNAALQAEHRGAAVLAYRRALHLDADFPRALQNLDHVRTQLPAWVPRPAPAGLLDTFFFYRSLARDTRALAGSIAFALAGIALGLSIRHRAGQGPLAWRSRAVRAGMVGARGLGRVRRARRGDATRCRDGGRGAGALGRLDALGARVPPTRCRAEPRCRCSSSARHGCASGSRTAATPG